MATSSIGMETKTQLLYFMARFPVRGKCISPKSTVSTSHTQLRSMGVRLNQWVIPRTSCSRCITILISLRRFRTQRRSTSRIVPWTLPWGGKIRQWPPFKLISIWSWGNLQIRLSRNEMEWLIWSNAVKDKLLYLMRTGSCCIREANHWGTGTILLKLARILKIFLSVHLTLRVLKVSCWHFLKSKQRFCLVNLTIITITWQTV